MTNIPLDNCPFCNHSLTNNQDLGIRLHCDKCLRYYVYLNKNKKITRFTLVFNDSISPEITVSWDIVNGSSEVVIFGKAGVTTKTLPLINYSDFSKIKNRIQKLLAFL